ncbi:hypothetical protein BH11MYX4_BH11MYX4_20280 [soil metagenome]
MESNTPPTPPRAAGHEPPDALLAEVAAKWGASEEAVALTTAAGSAQQARVVWVNAAFLALTGYTESQIIGASTVML